MAKRKRSGDGLPAGDWTQYGDGTSYPEDEFEETSKYRVLRQLSHDNVLYGPQQIVELTDDQAEPLLLHKVVEVATIEVPLT